MGEFASWFEVGLSPSELVVRGTAVFWFLFLLFRFVLRRDVGAMATADVLLLVIIADASQNAMGAYTTITEGFILIGTIAGWSLLFDWLGYRFRWFRWFVEAPPLPLVRDGRPIRSQMRRELVSMDELMSALREHGVERLADVKVAYMESQGSISVIKREQSGSGDTEGGQAKQSGVPPS